MAEGSTSRPNADAQPRAPEPQPPPLNSIRVKPAPIKGLNKPAILIVAGGALITVLALASGALSQDPRRMPADVKPMMSDPARPEMARGAIRDLPADYAQAATRAAKLDPPLPPQLGPPLPGDVAAFAPQQPDLRTYTPGPDDRWSDPQASFTQASGVSPANDEIEQADRSSLFFSLREDPKPPQDAPLQPVQQIDGNPLQRQLLTTPAERGSRALFPGAVISASLVTELNSEAPGPVIAQITQAIRDSATGRTLVIPQGARLIGDYRTSTRYGQNRVAILWSRIIMPDGQEIALDETAVDPGGAAGVAGKVDNRWTDVFGAAALGTLINIGVATTEEPRLSYGGIGIVPRDPVDAAINEGIQRGASQVTNRVVDRSLAAPPVIRLEAGSRVSVIVTRRLEW